MSDRIHEIITERMIAALESGTVPWVKPWNPALGRPRSLASSKPYRGVNTMLLGLAAMQAGYESPIWGTYRQIKELGGQVRRGEKSTPVIFWKRLELTGVDELTGEPSSRQVPMLRQFWAFNVAQADRLPAWCYPAPGSVCATEPQAVLDGYLEHGPQLRYVAGDAAHYEGRTDTITLPARSQFTSAADFYSAAFHECGHSTGHPSRLNRAGIADFDHFGSGRYAREELIAQMTSAMLCAETGIETADLFDQSTAYIACWLTALKDDKRLVVTAAAQAQKACDLITRHQQAEES